MANLNQLLDAGISLCAVQQLSALRSQCPSQFGMSSKSSSMSKTTCARRVLNIGSPPLTRMAIPHTTRLLSSNIWKCSRLVKLRFAVFELCPVVSNLIKQKGFVTRRQALLFQTDAKCAMPSSSRFRTALRRDRFGMLILCHGHISDYDNQIQT